MIRSLRSKPLATSFETGKASKIGTRMHTRILIGMTVWTPQKCRKI